MQMLAIEKLRFILVPKIAYNLHKQKQAAGESGEMMRRRTRYCKIQLIACDLFKTPRWSLPVIEPSHLPLPRPLPRAPVYPRLPHKIHLLPLR